MIRKVTPSYMGGGTETKLDLQRFAEVSNPYTTTLDDDLDVSGAINSNIINIDSNASFGNYPDYQYDGTDHYIDNFALYDMDGNNVSDKVVTITRWQDQDGYNKSEITNAGTYTLIVELNLVGEGELYVDDEPYSSPITRTLSITRATIRIIPINKSKASGTADPALTYIYEGNVPGEIPGFSGFLTRAPGETTGNYAITRGTLSIENGTGGFLAENYSAIYETGTFTITPAPPAGGNTPG